MEMSVEQLRARMAHEHLDELLAAAERVDPSPHRVRLLGRWMMEDEDDALVAQRRILEPRRDRLRRLAREDAARERDRLVARRVDRKKHDLAAVDDLAGLGRARVCPRRERT